MSVIISSCPEDTVLPQSFLTSAFYSLVVQPPLLIWLLRLRRLEKYIPLVAKCPSVTYS